MTPVVAFTVGALAGLAGVTWWATRPYSPRILPTRATVRRALG